MSMSESRSDLSLSAGLRLLAPLVELMLCEGVTYPRFANALKKTFLESGTKLLQESSAKVNDSSLSTLTGVHRKDVREWRQVGQPRPQAKTFNAVTEVFTRWASDPDYCDEQGRPRVLNRAGGVGSFEALAACVSRDVHPATLLQELVRLGVASRLDDDADGNGDQVSLCVDAFVPKEGSVEMLQLFADNASDHLAAAVHNLKSGNAPMLEQSVFADSLRPESIAALNKLCRDIWLNAFHDVVRDATVLSDQDQGQPGATQRMRVGMYFYHGPNLQA
jgi:hypothetical protein